MSVSFKTLSSVYPTVHETLKILRLNYLLLFVIHFSCCLLDVKVTLQYITTFSENSCGLCFYLNRYCLPLPLWSSTQGDLGSLPVNDHFSIRCPSCGTTIYQDLIVLLHKAKLINLLIRSRGFLMIIFFFFFFCVFFKECFNVTTIFLRVHSNAVSLLSFCFPMCNVLSTVIYLYIQFSFALQNSISHSSFDLLSSTLCLKAP